MVIHSVTPVEFLLPEQQPTQRRTQSFTGGWLEGEDTPEGFVVSRIISTDPSVYLNPSFTPGSICSPRTLYNGPHNGER